jgi:hypothetical protein
MTSSTGKPRKGAVQADRIYRRDDRAPRYLEFFERVLIESKIHDRGE